MKKEIIKGKIQGNERGFAFLIADERDEDYFIPHGDLKGALHGDTVICETTLGSGVRTTARVVKIVERGISKIVGTFFSTRRGGLVEADDKRFSVKVFIPSNKTLRAKTGDKVICSILSYPKSLSPEGIIVQVLGKSNQKHAELLAIEATYGLNKPYPEKAVKYANLLPEVKKPDFIGRRDLTDINCFTIDGDDSRDFDDAVSIKKDGENYVLGVHIADVSHYVRFNDVIDKCAFERGTSVYFPEKVIPMLPRRLSDNLCSLLENTDRLAISCLMTVNGAGKVVNREIFPSVIRSKKRLTYNIVQDVLDGSVKDVVDEQIVLDLKLMEELCDILIKRREKEGSIDLDVKESQILVSRDGEIDVVCSSSSKSHKIIEEFMVLANITVAEYINFLEIPFIYRVHDKPEQDRLKNFYAFLDGLGIRIKHKQDKVYPKDFQTILNEAKGSPFYTTINRVMLRSMQKAKYSENNSGHFGLSLNHYCHFTSPIRRYPDLMVHRILKDVLLGVENLEEKYGELVITASRQSSEKEKNAVEAERSVDDYYKLLYIKEKIGQTFNAVVSGVITTGIFCELDNGVEGFVKLENFSGDNYKCDAKSYTLTNGNKTYRLGQPVKIKVMGVDFGAKRADFLLEE